MFKKISILFLLLAIPAWAQSLPLGITPKEIVESGTIEGFEGQQFGLDRAGNLLRSYDYKVGNRIGVELSGVEYTLRFWNVGKMGGTSGWLFWKKDYSKAVLTLTPVASKPGIIVADTVDNSKMGLPDGWKMEPATKDPDFRSVSCIMTFSGGPQGEFAGTCNEGEAVKGRLVQGRSFVFTDVKDPEKQEALYIVRLKSFPLSDRAFGDWKIEETPCEDSGTRFNSISGTVEVASDSAARENRWGFAQLKTVLCVDDHVKTDEESEAILSFADMSTFLMAPETHLIINSPPKRDSKLDLVMGKIKANIKKMMKDGTMEIEMSQAVAGIKGTRFILTETGTESKIEVTEGTVAFRSKVSGETIMVTSGERVTAHANGFSDKEIFDKEADDESIQQLADYRADLNTTTDQSNISSVPSPVAIPKIDNRFPYLIIIVSLLLITVLSVIFMARIKNRQK